MLTLTDVHTHYAKSHILHGISLEVQPGEVIGLLGRNGVGKSTTLKSIMGLVRPSQGRITFEGRDIIARLHRDGVAILLVEQDVGLTLGASSRCYIMEKGLMRHHGPSAALKADPSIIHQYMGV